MKIAIAGASGFIGKNLIQEILLNTNYDIIALSRSLKENNQSERIEWRKCDLFSVLDIEKGIEGADCVIYLVHSMQPSARLDQASFEDYDLMLADNFGRAARKLRIKKTIYLGGLIPENTKDLSRHLISRLEVERSLSENIDNYTFLRAGLIMGEGGSSFHILLNLVRRLPILVCPSWTQNQTSPIHISQVTRSICEIIKSEEHFNKTYDLSSKDTLSYYNMLKLVAKYAKINRIFMHVPIALIWFSKLWVSVFSGAPRKLAYPLVESLKHTLLPKKENTYFPQTMEALTVEETVKKSLENIDNFSYKFTRYRPSKRKTVRSVQRADLPKGMNAEDLAKEYMQWLPKFLNPFILVKVDETWVYFCFLHPKIKLLILKWSPNRSTIDRQLFYIRGGLLAAKQDRGRLEFREVLNSTTTLSAIHEFYPSLPWYIYRYTQAIVHLFVMYFFGKHLERLAKKREKNGN